ncbi:MAG: T9SS C-terminal target domain-containing protein [Candidatus Latescibacterota bacterium]|nr:MAG: T9SS C-terminal target domain-containing protein [Candidatus Latescibacterota bacterium]
MMRFKIAGLCFALLLLLAGSAFAQWQYQYSPDLSYAFNAVHFPTASVGYIVGSGGVIYKSIDGGSTWTQQTSPTTNSLNDVFFRDANNGFAVGASGTIIYTSDGTNWSVHAQSGVITTTTINAVWFVGMNGWIGAGAASAACQIYSTSDGGATWANNVVTNPSLDLCTDISFASATIGYASVDRNGIMYTIDGGVNWTKSTVNLGPYPYTRTDIEAIYAVSTTHAVACGWGSNVGGQPTIILVSTDGGATFNTPDATYPWATYTYAYNFAKFDNGEVMLVGGGSQSAGISIHAMGPNYTTWTRYPAFYGESINDACVVPGTNKVVAVGDAGVVALSTDRGLTWTFLYDGGMPFQGVGAFADAGKNKIWGFGAGGALLYWDLAAGTYKYGMCSPKNWGPTTIGDLDYVLNPLDPPSGSYDSSYADVMYAAAGTGYLCKSYDQGKTWIELNHTLALYDGFLGMHWIDPLTGFLVGHKAIGNSRDEVIWKTTDGGYTLVEVQGPDPAITTSMQWNGISFAPGNPNVGAVVGDDNRIRYTADGGATWPYATENIATSTLDLEEVVMINSTTGFAVGDGGTLVKTTDGGASWLVQAPGWGTVNLTHITFNTPNRLWVSGADQFLWYSVDGGATWTNANVTPIVSTYDVMTVHYQGAAGILWVGCHYANVLSRTDAVAGVETPKSLPFVLNQNFPNPFNPSTTIAFTLASDDHVTLNVYNVAGKLVATVMDRDLKAGDYSVAFRADGLATGVYFYKLSTSRGEETRKMVLLR